jgi:drug/metabolite transporter (DMT)-like permease
MPAAALALVSVAALAHATWNLLAKTARGGRNDFVWLSAILGAALLGGPAIAIAATSPHQLTSAALGFVVGSGVLHAAYFVLLQRAYAEGDLSVVYPLARGTGPLLATTAAIAFLDERPAPLALAGATLIIAAVLALGLSGGQPAENGSKSSLYALATGVTIAAYTLWDKEAVSVVGLSPIVYFCGGELVIAALLAPLVLRDPVSLRQSWRVDRRNVTGTAALASLSYVLVLYALSIAPVSYVAPAREVSILIAAALGIQVLDEGQRARRLACAAAIMAGIAALALG